jgi:S1-C subfamily serine protease
MKQSIPATVILLVTVALAGCRNEKPLDRQKQEILLRQYRKLPVPTRATAETALKAQGTDLPAALADFDSHLEIRLSPLIEQRMQAVIDESLVPVPILQGKFQPVLAQSPNASAPVLSLAQQQDVLQRAASVGRLQTFNGSRYLQYGTGFVVGKNQNSGLIATNCHVIDDRRLIPTVPDDSGEVISATANFEIDFDDGPARSPVATFKMSRVMPCAKTGLDVALLLTDLNSIDGSGQLPVPLTLLNTALTNNFSVGQTELVGAVGYPMLGEADQTDRYSRLFTSFDARKYAKFYSPGAITMILRNSGIDFLLHDLSTMTGYSGSPLLDLASRVVVGVHACCTSPGGQLSVPTSRLPCAQRTITPEINFSLSGWSVRGDTSLMKTLKDYGVV